MPKSYRIHPILNIVHLEKYQPLPAEFGNQPTKSLNHADFDELPEYEVEMIIADRRKKGRKGDMCLNTSIGLKDIMLIQMSG